MWWEFFSLYKLENFNMETLPQKKGRGIFPPFLVNNINENVPFSRYKMYVFIFMMRVVSGEENSEVTIQASEMKKK